MKDFTEVNDWLIHASFSDLTNTISRAVSRVTNARNDIFKIEPEYVSGYNSIQTLGYDSKGQIQDQTSSDRLTIPNGVLSKYKAILRQYRRALAVDRDQFTAELSSSLDSLTTLLPTTALYYPNNQSVVNFGGVVDLVISRGSTITAKASVPKYIADLLGTDAVNSKLSRMPTVVYANMTFGMLAMEWSNAYTYPVPTQNGDTVKKWRVVLFKHPDAYYHLIVTFNADRLYNFHFTGATLTNNALNFGEAVISSESFRSVSDFENLLLQSGFPAGSYAGGMLEIDPDNFWAPRWIPRANLSANQETAYSYLLNDDWSETVSEAIFSVATGDSVYREIFNKISTITPELLDSLINLLN